MKVLGRKVTWSGLYFLNISVAIWRIDCRDGKSRSGESS